MFFNIDYDIWKIHYSYYAAYENLGKKDMIDCIRYLGVVGPYAGGGQI